MKLMLSIAALAAVATAGAGEAQPYGVSRGSTPTATLYELPGYQGRQTVIYGHADNLPRQFNDMAMSARFQGRWRVCDNADYGGRCLDLQGDVPDLNGTGLAQRVSSLQAYAEIEGGGRGDPGGDRYGGGGYGGGRYDRDDDDRNDRNDRDRSGRSDSAEGVRNVFFAYPTLRGSDIAAGGNAADSFCRANGLGPAAYFETSARSNRAVDGAGRPTGPTNVLRDVLCRK